MWSPSWRGCPHGHDGDSASDPYAQVQRPHGSMIVVGKIYPLGGDVQIIQPHVLFPSKTSIGFGGGVICTQGATIGRGKLILEIPSAVE